MSICVYRDQRFQFLLFLLGIGAVLSDRIHGFWNHDIF
jgi:hypothetical protein